LTVTVKPFNLAVLKLRELESEIILAHITSILAISFGNASEIAEFTLF